MKAPQMRHIERVLMQVTVHLITRDCTGFTLPRRKKSEQEAVAMIKRIVVYRVWKREGKGN